MSYVENRRLEETDSSTPFKLGFRVLSTLVLLCIAIFSIQLQPKENYTKQTRLIESILRNVDKVFQENSSYPLGSLNRYFITYHGTFKIIGKTLFPINLVQVFHLDGATHFYHPDLGVFDFEGNGQTFTMKVRNCDIIDPECKETISYTKTLPHMKYERTNEN